jgi:hypothetical protein
MNGRLFVEVEREIGLIAIKVEPLLKALHQRANFRAAIGGDADVAKLGEETVWSTKILELFKILTA